MFNFKDRVMKKNLFGWLAMATMLVGTGCSSDEVVNDYSPENAIQFGTYVGRDADSRGSIFTTNNLQNDVDGSQKIGFGVFAYYTGQVAWNQYTISDRPNFMNNTRVTYNSSVWEYSPLKYWPNNSNDKISFFAYAPYSANRTLNGGSTINISVPEDVSSHVDYVVAEGKTDMTKQGLNDKVVFNFKHILSRVGFKVEAVVDQQNQTDGTTDEDNQTNVLDNNTKITIQEVQLNGNFSASKSIDFTTSTWFDDATTYTSFTGYLLQSSDFTELATNGNINITKSDLLNKDSEYMMIIPKNFANTAENPGQITIRVKYTVETTDTDVLNGKSTIVNDITSQPFNFNFEQGKAYNFVLHLGLTSVKLSAEVSGWDETNIDKVVNVPMNHY